MTDVDVVAEPLIPGAEATPWPEAHRRLAEAEVYWLATSRPDGTPHVRPVLGVWLDRTMYFAASLSTRKGTNLVDNDRCAVTVSSLTSPAIDLVVEGRAAKVGDEAVLRRVAAVYDEKYGWEVTVEADGFHAEGAPTAGPPPYAVFELRATKAFGFPADGHGDGDTGQGSEIEVTSTRWRFAPEA